MAEVLTPVDEVFSAPGFGTALTEWQHARLIARERSGQLANHIAGKQRQDRGRSQYDIDVEVEYAMGLSEEEFAGVFSYDSLAMRLGSLRTTADTAEHEANDALIETGKEHGLGQFAVYGLWLHTRESGIIPKSDLREKTAQAEHDFGVVDKFIRDNNGRLLTVTNTGTGAYAGRLGGGGIELDEKYKLTIPVEGPCYAISFLQNLGLDEDKVYETQRLHLDTSDIHSIFGTTKIKLFDSWRPLLDAENIYGYREATLAAGDVVEGPPHIPQELRSQDFYQMVFNRTRTISRLAMLNS